MDTTIIQLGDLIARSIANLTKNCLLNGLSVPGLDSSDDVIGSLQQHRSPVLADDIRNLVSAAAQLSAVLSPELTIFRYATSVRLDRFYLSLNLLINRRGLHQPATTAALSAVVNANIPELLREAGSGVSSVKI